MSKRESHPDHCGVPGLKWEPPHRAVDRKKDREVRRLWKLYQKQEEEWSALRAAYYAKAADVQNA